MPLFFHWDGTVTFGNVLTMIVFTLVFLKFYSKIVRFIDKIELIIDEFPPHTHVRGLIRYPKGMEPADPITLEGQEGPK
jgi:hypothetical protein